MNLKIGDKIAWRFFEDRVYTVIDIDLSRPINYQIQLQWKDDSNEIISIWIYNYHELNWLIKQGNVFKIIESMEPVKKINPFSFS